MNHIKKPDISLITPDQQLKQNPRHFGLNTSSRPDLWQEQNWRHNQGHS